MGFNSTFKGLIKVDSRTGMSDARDLLSLIDNKSNNTEHGTKGLVYGATV